MEKTANFWDVIKWIISRKKRGVWTRSDVVQVVPEPRVLGDSVVVTFVGHSTVLIQTGGVNIITDPIWSERASPVSFVGPRRYRNPGVAIKSLPKIDIILLSHNHYDHCDKATLMLLVKRDNPRIIVPSRTKLWSLTPTTLDWWEDTIIDVGGTALQVTAVPAKHFSGRTPFDRNRSLWCGYIIATPSKVIYFAGDTGHSDIFKEIREKMPKIASGRVIDLSLIPVGAYEPRWFMSTVHVNPAEAVMIHKDVHSKKSIGIHFGTFRLTDEGQDAPHSDLKKALREEGLSEQDFVMLAEGEKLTI